MGFQSMCLTMASSIWHYSASCWLGPGDGWCGGGGPGAPGRPPANNQPNNAINWPIHVINSQIHDAIFKPMVYGSLRYFTRIMLNKNIFVIIILYFSGCRSPQSLDVRLGIHHPHFFCRGAGVTIVLLFIIFTANYCDYC